MNTVEQGGYREELGWNRGGVRGVRWKEKTDWEKRKRGGWKS